MNSFFETLYDAYGQEFRIDEILFENKTSHQHLLIFHNAKFGRVMALDGIVQTTEKDEFIYHEMLAHVPIIAYGNVNNILIIGGGDGAMLREVCRHENIKNITQVEIDKQVIEMCKKHLPNHSNGAFDDSRVKVVIDDGLNFVKNTQQKFDVIISDSTDPIGPGEVLFTDDYYLACKKCLTPGGIFVAQNGVPFMQLDELINTAKRIRPLFKDWHFYNASIPTYIGGDMTFTWATDNIELRHINVELLTQRYKDSKIKTRYYNPEIHFCSFALPQYILDAIEKDTNEYR